MGKLNTVLDAIMAAHPNYQNFKPGDFTQLREDELRTMLGMIAAKVQIDTLIPRSFTQQFGDNAPAELALALERAAAKRNQSEMYARALLDGGLSGESHIGIESNVAASLDLAGGKTVRSTAPRILNYVITQDAVEQMAKNEAARQQGTFTPKTNLDVTIPPSITAPIVKANPRLPQSMVNTVYAVSVGDETAFMSGYATRAGASNDIGPVTIQYPEGAVCSLPKIVGQIFDPKKPDLDVGLAWVAGYIQRGFDQMSPADQNQLMAQCPKPAKVNVNTR